MKRLGWIIAVSLLGAAVAQELRKPTSGRDWTGKLGGVLPYDLRPPTLERLRSRFWSPDDARIFMPHGFGVGWTVNVGRLVQLGRRGVKPK